MYRYEVSYRDNGILKNKGFKYEEDFNKFLTRLKKNPVRYTDIRMVDNTKKYSNVEKLGVIIGKRLNIRIQ